MVHEYIGSKITIISRNDKRYEGVLHSIDVEKSTITLKDVRYFENGPDGVPGPASSTVFEMIVFRGSDITDLAVCQPAETEPNNHEIPDDPAILSVNGGSNFASNQTIHDVSSNAMSQQQRQFVASSGNQRGSPKMSYSNAVSGGRHAINNQGGGSSVGYNKDNSKNRQRNNGYPGRSCRGGFGGGVGGGGGGMGGGHQRSFVVGELKPRINQALKAELETEFDFSEHNKKFEKTINGSFSIYGEQGSKQESSHSGQNDQLGAIKNAGSGLGGGSGSPSLNSESIEADQSKKLMFGGYNKGSGFFDSISCETLDPERSKRLQGGPPDPQIKAMRERQKLIDKETFGASAVKPRPGSYNRGPNNRRGGYQSSHRFNKREA